MLKDIAAEVSSEENRNKHCVDGFAKYIISFFIKKIFIESPSGSWRRSTKMVRCILVEGDGTSSTSAEERENWRVSSGSGSTLAISLL